jgi:hypothetical protein
LIPVAGLVTPVAVGPMTMVDVATAVMVIWTLSTSTIGPPAY